MDANEMEKVIEEMEKVARKLAELRPYEDKIVQKTLDNFERIRIDTSNKEAIEEINEEISDYMVRVLTMDEYAPLIFPQIAEEGKVALVDIDGNEYNDRILTADGHHLLDTIGDVVEFYKAWKKLIELLEQKGVKYKMEG